MVLGWSCFLVMVRRLDTTYLLKPPKKGAFGIPPKFQWMDGNGETNPFFSIQIRLGIQLKQSNLNVDTWRIIPFSKWLITMVSRSPK